MPNPTPTPARHDNGPSASPEGPFSLSFVVAGDPVTQGSSRAFYNPKTGRAMITSTSGQKLKDWRDQIGFAAREAMRGMGFVDEGPLVVTATFYLSRPKSRPKKYLYPDRKPDLDKLERALLDAMSGVIFRDDAQVVDLNTRKRYAEDGPGVSVHVRAL